MVDNRPQADRILVAQLTGEARHHAKWRDLSSAEEAAAVAALTELAAGRADLLAEVAGLLEGFQEGEPYEPIGRPVAMLCGKAGADPDAMPEWASEGRRRRAAARLPPPSGSAWRGNVSARKSSERSAAYLIRSDRLTAVSIVVSLAALGLALYATLNADHAASKANQLASEANSLAASVASATLTLAPGSPTSSIARGSSMFQVRLGLLNQGGGTARYVTVYLGTVGNIHAKLAGSCPPPVGSPYYFSFPSGRAVGQNDTLTGTASVPTTALHGLTTPTNSMMLYVSWQNNGGSTQLNCEDLSNKSTVGNLDERPSH